MQNTKRKVPCFVPHNFFESACTPHTNAQPMQLPKSTVYETERLHLHGIVWGIGTDQLIREKWNYGITYTGNFVNEKTINYITKYMTKIDENHPEFVGKVLCSKGIGAGYIKTAKRGENKTHITF